MFAEVIALGEPQSSTATFTIERLIRLVIAAVGVAALIRLGRWLLQYFWHISISNNEAVLLGSGVTVLLLLTDSISDSRQALTFATVIVAGYFASRLATSFIR